jgi:hypothetical protein
VHYISEAVERVLFKCKVFVQQSTLPIYNTDTGLVVFPEITAKFDTRLFEVRAIVLKNIVLRYLAKYYITV